MGCEDFAGFSAFFLRAAEQNGVGALLNEERLRTFYTLTGRLIEVNRTFNLTAIEEPEKIILLHYIDCLAGATFFPESASVIDVGCGAGFPCLPLAIVRPDLRIVGLDATAKRVKYVEETAALLGLSGLSCLCGRAEDIAAQKTYRERFDCATARAVAAMPVLCELCLPFVREGGLFVAMKGRAAEEELAAAAHAVSVLGGNVEKCVQTPVGSPSGEEYAHASILIRKCRPTPGPYPRPYAKIVKKPL